MFMTLLDDGVTVIFYASGGTIINADNVDDNPFIIMMVFGKQSAGHHESSKKNYRLGKRWIDKRQNAAGSQFDKPFVPITRRCPGWLEWSETDRATGKGMFVPIPDRVAVVQRVFTDLASGMGRDSIARVLNAERIPTWGKGVHWHGGTVQKITENRAVLGEMQMHTAVENPKHPGHRKLALRKPVGEPLQGYYPAVIAPELWRAARAVSDRRAPIKIANTGGRIGTKCGNLFATMAICGHCRGPMVRRDPHHSRGEPKYKCRWSTEAKCETRTTFSYLKVEKGLLRWARDYAPSTTNPEETRHLEGEIATMLEQRDAMRLRRGKLIERFGDEDDPQAAEIIDRFKSEIANLDRRIQAAQHKLDRLRRIEVVHQTLIDEMPAKLAAATTDEEIFSIRVAVRGSLKDVIREIRFYSNRIRVVTVGKVLTAFCDVEGNVEHVVAHEFGWWLDAEKDGPRDFARYAHLDVEERESIRRMYNNIDRLQARFIELTKPDRGGKN